MTASLSQIKRWVAQEESKGESSHLLVVTDTFDHENYPVPVKKGDSLQDKISKYSKNMQKVEEIYSFSGKVSIEDQLAKVRSWHTE